MPFEKIARLSGMEHSLATRGSPFEHDGFMTAYGIPYEQVRYAKQQQYENRR